MTACVLMLIPAAAWQRQVSAVMGMEGPATRATCAPCHRHARRRLCVSACARAASTLIKTMARYFIRRWHLHDEVALFIGTAIVVVLAITLINGVLFRGFLAGANRVFQPQNTTTRAGVTQPMHPERSGSPASFAPWDTLGYQGRNFVATGPHADELTRLNGKPAKEPIRVYAGLQTADTDRERMSVLLTRTRAHPRLRPQGAGDRPDHRHGWVNPVGRARAGDDVQRRHRHGRHRSIPICPAGFRSSATPRSRWIPAG